MAELEDGDLVDSIYCFVALITMRNNRRAWKVEPSEPKLGLTFYVLITMPEQPWPWLLHRGACIELSGEPVVKICSVTTNS